MTDLIRDADGQVSKTVRDYIKASGKTPELQAALEDFFELFREQRLVTRDILHHNLVVQMGAEKITIYMIDGFGSSELLPVSSWLPFVGARKVEHKIDKFNARYGLAVAG